MSIGSVAQPMTQLVFRFREPAPLKHGTRYAYVKGCRCAECKEANNLYIARYKADARFKRGLQKPGRKSTPRPAPSLTSEDAWSIQPAVGPATPPWRR